MSDEAPDTRATLAKVLRLCETLVSEVATLKGYAEKHEASIEGIDTTLAHMKSEIVQVKAALVNQGSAIFAFSKDLNDVRTSVLGPSARPPAIEHERIDRLSERAR